MRKDYSLFNRSFAPFALNSHTSSAEEEESGRECVAKIQGKSLRGAYVG